MTQELRDKVAEAITIANDDCATGILNRGTNEALYVADAALQAIADHIGCEVDGLEHLREAIGALEMYAQYTKHNPIKVRNKIPLLKFNDPEMLGGIGLTIKESITEDYGDRANSALAKLKGNAK